LNDEGLKPALYPMSDTIEVRNRLTSGAEYEIRKKALSDACLWIDTKE